MHGAARVGPRFSGGSSQRSGQSGQSEAEDSAPVDECRAPHSVANRYAGLGLGALFKRSGFHDHFNNSKGPAVSSLVRQQRMATSRRPGLAANSRCSRLVKVFQSFPGP